MTKHPERDDVVSLDIREVTRRLNVVLGGTLVASLAGAPDPTVPYQWARPRGPQPNAESITRLRFAYEQWRAVAAAEGDDVARAWFIGANPWLDQQSPVDAICSGHLENVAAAARAFRDGSFSG